MFPGQKKGKHSKTKINISLEMNYPFYID